MEKIEAFNNNCTLVAVKSVLNGSRSDAEILAAFREEGYVDNRGMTHSRWTNAAARLGLELETVKITRPRGGKWMRRRHPWQWEDEEPEIEYYKRAQYTLAQFCKDNPVGTFFVSLHRHAIVVVDGMVWDPNCVFSGMSRGVEAAKLVKNSPLKRITGGRIRSLKIGRGASGKRRLSALNHLTQHGPTTGRELVANTEYTQADLDWDEKRGNLVYER